MGLLYLYEKHDYYKTLETYETSFIKNILTSANKN